MGFFDFLDPNERRWRNERKEKAREYRQDAKEYLQEAKELYEDDYKELKSDARELSYNVGKIIKQHINFKADLLKELDGDINASIKNFKRFNIDSRVIKSIDIESDRFSMSPVSLSAVSNFPSNIGGDFSLPSLLLSAFSDPEKDVEKASEQKSKALEYLMDVKVAIAEMRDTIQILQGTKKYVEDEREILDELMEKVRKIVGQLKSAMKKESYTDNEARYVKGICKIAEIIKGTLETQIANSDGTISSNYKNYSDRIWKINQSIPSAPRIEESSNWLNLLIQY